MQAARCSPVAAYVSTELGVDLAAENGSGNGRDVHRIGCLAAQDLTPGSVGRIEPWDGGQQHPRVGVRGAVQDVAR
jgi:hypothetical protein